MQKFPFATLSDFRWPIFQYLQKFSLHPDAEVRNAAIWGYGLMIPKIPKHLLGAKEVGEIVDVAQKASSIEQGGEENSTYNHFSDNCVAVLGILLQ